MARSASAATGGLPRRLRRTCSAPRWPDARPAGRRAAAARPRGSARAAAPPAWRCGAPSRWASTGRSPRAGTAVAVTGAAPAGPARPTPPRGRRSVAARSARARASAVGRRVAPASAAPLPALAVVVAPPLARAGGEDDRDVGRALRSALDLDPPLGLLRRTGGLGRGERQDLDALEADVDVGPQHGADLLARRHQGAVDGALGLARASGAPGPRPVARLARQFDVDPA